MKLNIVILLLIYAMGVITTYCLMKRQVMEGDPYEWEKGDRMWALIVALGSWIVCAGVVIALLLMKSPKLYAKLSKPAKW